jgi:recombination protein RecA
MNATLQSVLNGPHADLLRFRPTIAEDTLPSGVPGLDLPRGAVTEIHGPASSGRASIRNAALAQATQQDEICALIDVEDAFDPASAAAAGVALDRLLWVRCGHQPERALKVADLILQGGGFGLVAMDLAGTPIETARRIPPASWFRFRHAVQNTRSVFLIIEPAPCARSSASLSLETRRQSETWTGVPDCSQLLTGVEIQVERHKPGSGTFDFCLLPFDF